MIYDLIIIGAGPAGFVAGIEALKHGKNVLMMNTAAKPLLKLLASGGGACNFTHDGDAKEFLENYTVGKNFFRKQFYSYDNYSFVEYLESAGIATFCREDGKYFPQSMEAGEIRDFFLKAFLEKGRLINDCKARAASYDASTKLFNIETNCGDFEGKKLLLACGGQSYPTTGSDGSGFKLATQLGHTIVPPQPALSSVNICDHILAHASGLSFEEVELSSYSNGKKNFSAAGALIITHKGLSGPVILDNSHQLAAGMKLVINFSGASLEQTIQEIKQQKINSPNKLFSNLPIFSILSQRILEEYQNSLKMNFFHKKTADINLQEIKLAARLLSELELEIESVDSWNKAMATAGGVATSEVNPASMESRITPGLYFAGEILDILGKTGGYNIQAAYSTAKAFANNI
ncbi:MAG: aminoacetone oxidase family FAD-binding enzyme [Spirochaetales bacterium]|nr:aminoacetone oxidase family FAD-binding enzyme [Spirochaetales bacterium]